MFNSRDPQIRPGSTRVEDHLRTVEIDMVFRRLRCYKCDLTAVYKYRVMQIRRQPELMPPGEVPNDQPTAAQGVPEGTEGAQTAATQTSVELSDFDLELWKTIPRFAEIPETVRCKRCGEVLGLCTECIF
jgi:hypothetical protein